MKNKKKRMKRYMVYIAALALAACSGAKTADEDEAGVATMLPAESNEVTVQVLEKKVFEHELVSNGKLVAGKQADLRFETAGVVVAVHVKNGERVQAGQVIAELDKFRLANQVAQTKDALEKARLELQDVLIGQGYAADAQEEVPADVMRLARVRSGYDQAEAQYALAKYEEEHASLKAPFDGVVANLETRGFNRPDGSKPFCRVIGSGGMEVAFKVLESELPLVRRGDRVEVAPFAGTAGACSGTVSEINPLVDENGLVSVRARVNGGARLFDGMNVRVSVKRSVAGQLVVPKTAVVLRSGKKVVFTLSSGKAVWNYVQTGLENATHCTILEGLKEGDTVIVSGNINLAHEAPVTVVNEL